MQISHSHYCFGEMRRETLGGLHSPRVVVVMDSEHLLFSHHLRGACPRCSRGMVPPSSGPLILVSLSRSAARVCLTPSTLCCSLFTPSSSGNPSSQESTKSHPNVSERAGSWPPRDRAQEAGGPMLSPPSLLPWTTAGQPLTSSRLKHPCAMIDGYSCQRPYLSPCHCSSSLSSDSVTITPE